VSVFLEQGIEKIYTVKLCELIYLWNKQGLPFVVLDKEDLRAKLGIDRTLYSRNYDFRVHVLDKAINELQQTMGIMVNYEQIKKGKMVKQYRFLFNNDKKG
jgi:plasmid replication initiation protein